MIPVVPRPPAPRPNPTSLALPALALALAACATARVPADRGAPPAGEASQPAVGRPSPLPAAGGPVAPAPAREPPPRTLARATIAAVGDVMVQEAVKRAAAVHGAGWPDDGYAWLLAPVADLLAAPDLTFANLETPVAPAANRGTREYMFNAPVASARALLRTGFDVVSVANNHAFDQGRAGFEETVRTLEALGLRPAGAGPASRSAGPLFLEVNGLRIALLAYAYGFNQPGNDCPAAAKAGCLQASILDRERAPSDVVAAGKEADAVLVSLHWGVEYEQQPRAEDVELARRLADAGALAVIGHHPHVLQPVELYRRPDGSTALLAYSLGNFLSNQSRRYVHGVTPAEVGSTRDGAILRLAIERRDYGRGVIRVELAGADLVPLWTENDTAEIDPKREPDRRPAIRVVAVDRALAEVRAALSGFPDPVPPGRQDEWIRLRGREALLAARREASATVLGAELVRTLAPAELAAPAPAWAPERTAVTGPGP
jgi:poly-gamma-glutamate synthesis protein (capsule biosynthesis protein)